MYVVSGPRFVNSFLISLDEVGRGCLAGPLCVGASLWEISNEELQDPGFRDSKALLPAKRKKLVDLIWAKNVLSHSYPSLTSHVMSLPFQDLNLKSPLHFQHFHPHSDFCHWKLKQVEIGFATSSEIDGKGLTYALGAASQRALFSLSPPKNVDILVDGIRPFLLAQPHCELLQVLCPKADQIFKTVSVSSLVAKVFRDKWMTFYDEVFPQYGFAQHKGYGTKQHFQKIKKHGLSLIHRKTFLKKEKLDFQLTI
jgi:ribonuclease HII